MNGFNHKKEIAFLSGHFRFEVLFFFGVNCYLNNIINCSFYMADMMNILKKILHVSPMISVLDT